MTTKEVWRVVPSVPGVMASNAGRVMLAPFVGQSERAGPKQYGGVPTVGCWDGNRYICRFNNKNFKVARLVCEAFNGSPSQGNSVCMHIDEDSRNNAPSNLAWGTQKQNLNAPGFLRYCRSRTGENSPTVKAKRNTA